MKIWAYRDRIPICPSTFITIFALSSTDLRSVMLLTDCAQAVSWLNVLFRKMKCILALSFFNSWRNLLKFAFRRCIPVNRMFTHLPRMQFISWNMHTDGCALSLFRSCIIGLNSFPWIYYAHTHIPQDWFTGIRKLYDYRIASWVTIGFRYDQVMPNYYKYINRDYFAVLGIFKWIFIVLSLLVV